MGYTNGLLSALSHAQSGVTLTDLVYEYGPDGQLTAIVDQLDPAKSKTISYDALNRLVQVAEGIPAPAGVPVPVEDYAYDGEGNRTASHLSALYSSNDHNQLLEDDDYTYAYDTKGNRISRTRKSDGRVETYSYDSQNRLVGYSSPTTTATYAYDALDRRIAKTVDGTVTAYIYDMSPDDPLAHDDILLEFDTTAAPAILTRRWAHSDSVDEPLGFEAYNASGGAGTGAERAIFADRQGSVIWVTEPASGSVVAAYEYDGYGQITQTQGTLVQPYGYTGREYDHESGLYHYRARAYDPRTGTFIQSDPIELAGGTISIYQFVQGDPVNLGDPTGLMAADMAINTGVSAGAATAGGYGIFATITPALGRVLQVMRTAGTLLPVVVVGSSAPDMPPPGDCDKAFVAKIRKNLKRIAQQGYSCQGLPKSAIVERSLRGGRAAQVWFWRDFLNNICFRGSNLEHRTEAASARNSMMECFAVDSGAWP